MTQRQRRGLVALLAVALLVLGATTWAVVAKQPLRRFEVAFLSSFWPPPTDGTAWQVAKQINLAADSQVAALVTLVAAAVAFAMRRRRAATAAVIAVLIAATVAWVLKQSVDRPGTNHHFAGSFPSGHTAMAVVTAWMLVSIIGTTRRFAFSALAATLWGVDVAWARVFEAIHWPSDVVAGLALGFASVAAAELLAGVRRQRA